MGTPKAPPPSKAIPPQAPPRPALPPSVAPVPVAQPVAANVPLAAPINAAPTGANLNFASTADMVVPRVRRAVSKGDKGRRPSWIVWGIAAVLGGALAVWAGLWYRHFLKMDLDKEGATQEAGAYNCRFAWPSKPWRRDADMQMKFHVHIGMKSAESNSGMALLFKDYKTRLPSDAEMLDEALGKLRSYFLNLEWELKPKDEQARLAGRPVQILEFQGDTADQVTMNGECYTMASRGYGYWFFTWAPLGDLEQDGEAIRADWTKLRQRLTLLDGRKGWKEKPRETEGVAGKKAKYHLNYVKGLWALETSQDEDPQVDLLLKGYYPKDAGEKPVAGKNATVQALVLPKEADLKAAAAAALAYVKQREEKLYPGTKMEPIKDKNGEVNREAKIGAENGHLTKLHVKSTEDLERYLLIAVVNRVDGVIVFVGDCLWERHEFWDQEFMVLLDTFKAKVR
jgi:hypothetical protein